MAANGITSVSKSMMARKGTSILHTSFPLYAIHLIDDKHFIVAGGGGRARTGITNSIVCRLLCNL